MQLKSRFPPQNTALHHHQKAPPMTKINGNWCDINVEQTLNSPTGSQTTKLYPLKSQILTFSGQGLQSSPKNKPQVIFSIGKPPRPCKGTVGGMAGITDNLANFCGFCWFFTKRKILFGVKANRYSKLIYVLTFWTQFGDFMVH